MFFQRRRYKFDKEYAYHSYCNYIQKTYPLMKFTRENDRSLHHFYSFLWNQKHPFLFLGRMMFMSLLSVVNMYATNYFICKEQHIYTVLYDRKNNVYAVLDSNEEQIRYVTSSELYQEIVSAEYVFMELNDSIIPSILSKLDRMETKGEQNRINSQNVRQVVVTYQNSLKHEDMMDPSVIQQRMIQSSNPPSNSLVNDLAKPFEEFDQRLFKKPQAQPPPPLPPKPVSKPVSKTLTKQVEPEKAEQKVEKSVIPSVSIKEPDTPPPPPSESEPPKSTRRFDRKTPIIPAILPCDGCPSIGRGSSSESLQERRAKRNMVTSKASAETEEDRQKRIDQMANVIKEKAEKANQSRNPDAKSVSYYRKLRTEQKLDRRR